MTLSPIDRQSIIDYRLERAFSTFEELKYVVRGRFWNLAANRMYYSVFYACIALLLKEQLITTSHAGVSRMMGLHFVSSGVLDDNDGKLLKRLFRMRQSGDYDDLSDWDEDDIIPYIEPTERLLKKIAALTKK